MRIEAMGCDEIRRVPLRGTLMGNQPPLSGNQPPLSGNPPPLRGYQPPLRGNQPPLSGTHLLGADTME